MSISNNQRKILIDLATNNIELVDQSSNNVSLLDLMNEEFNIDEIKIKELPEWIRTKKCHYWWSGGKKSGYVIIRAENGINRIRRRINGDALDSFLKDFQDNCFDAVDAQNILHDHFNRI